MPTPITQCRICGNTELEPILQLGDQKLTGIFPETPDAKIMGGPLDLVRCVPSECDCGLLQLRHSYPLEAMYGDNYGYRSGLNSSMARHLEAKTPTLIQQANAQPGDVVVDIGCNDGTLLKSYPAHFERCGIDPVAKKFLHLYPPEIRVVTEFFTPDLWAKSFAGQEAKIITSIAMFYDLENPLAFMEAIHDALAPDGIWHFEQSYMPLMLEHCAYDTICHEHIEYYALRQIQWMMARSGLKIIKLETSNVNGGSLSVTAARRDSRHEEALVEIATLTRAETAAGLEGMDPLWKFRDRIFQHRDALLSAIKNSRAAGHLLGGYGASTKGNVLLQFCGLTSNEIPFIAEVNEEKFGHFTPGTGIPIISEAEMHQKKPDILLVLPWHFRENLIAREEAFLARGGRLLFPLPVLEYFPQ